jgi:hypothetical protein
MSLRDLNPHTRRRLRFHGWLLTLWCVGVGLLASWLLLHAFGVRSPAVRYAISAIVMYSLGLVVGARIWLVHFSASVQAEPGLLVAATPDDVAAFDAEQLAKQLRPAGKKKGGFDWGDLLGGALESLDFGDAAALLIIPALIVALVGLLLAAGVFPVMLLDGAAGLLAEVAVQFVFGALIARRVMRPQAHDEAFLSIVGKTWLAGVLFVVASGGTGWVLTLINPGGASIADLFR